MAEMLVHADSICLEPIFSIDICCDANVHTQHVCVEWTRIYCETEYDLTLNNDLLLLSLVYLNYSRQLQMNVVMPTAMTSMHTDPDLSANAARTARRGARILGYLKDKDQSVATNCEAILVAAMGEGSADEELVKVSSTCCLSESFVS